MDELTVEQLSSCRRKIGDGIESFVSSSGARGVVVAVSGGIDSALVLKLASSVVDTHALIMPDLDVSDELDTKDAEDLCDSFGVPYSVVTIGETIAAVNEAFPWVAFGEENRRLAVANVKPRVRMLFNYLLSNLDSRVVLGTGNKTELLIGYFTKFGDGACDFEPIGGLYKTQVRQLAAFLGLPQKIIDKKPSAGLWAGQTDEEELGVSYDVLDDVLHLLVDESFSEEAAAKELDLDLDLVQRIGSWVKKNEHKRKPPGVVELDL